MFKNLIIFDTKFGIQMPTYIKTGIYQPPFTKEDEAEQAVVYIDENVVQVLDDKDELVLQFTYEELRGIMAVMAAEQEKSHLYIQARTKLN